MTLAGRVSPVAKPGSLFKGATKPRKGGSPQGSTGRDTKHLALIRQLPCLSCDTDPAGIAAHVRMTRVGKPIAGTGNKPGDHWTLPLCPQCHTDGPNAQHVVGEVPFWRGLGLDALVVCQRLYAASPDIEAMRAAVFAEREKRR